MTPTTSNDCAHVSISHVLLLYATVTSYGTYDLVREGGGVD